MSLPSTPTYRVTCPWCNGALYPVVLDPASAPWVCVICRHGWWVAELVESARVHFRPAFCDFGFRDPARQITADVIDERMVAHERNTSCRSDQLALVPLSGLQIITTTDAAFEALVQAEIIRKGG